MWSMTHVAVDLNEADLLARMRNFEDHLVDRKTAKDAKDWKRRQLLSQTRCQSAFPRCSTLVSGTTVRLKLRSRTWMRFRRGSTNGCSGSIREFFTCRRSSEGRTDYRHLLSLFPAANCALTLQAYRMSAEVPRASRLPKNSLQN